MIRFGKETKIAISKCAVIPWRQLKNFFKPVPSEVFSHFECLYFCSCTVSDTVVI